MLALEMKERTTGQEDEKPLEATKDTVTESPLEPLAGTESADTFILPQGDSCWTSDLIKL